MTAIILSVPLSKLAKVNEGFTEEFFDDLLANIPQFGVKRGQNYIINNSLTLSYHKNLAMASIFNTFVNLSTIKHNLIFITKN